MALVSYSDSEASDSEQDTKPTPTPAPPASSTGATKPSIVDRSNPRKIRVALPEIKPDPSQDSEDGPARKKPKIGGGGGAFSGFSSFLPAPKRTNATAEQDKKKTAPARKVFSLKTGATPGFDRSADAEMRNEQAFAAMGGDGPEDDDTIPKAGSLQAEEFGETQTGTDESDGLEGKKKPEEVKLKGNPMMFKPLSVGRAQKKKKALANTTAPLPAVEGLNEAPQPAKEKEPVQPTPPPVAQKPKVSLFSLSSQESSTPSAPAPQAKSTAYEPLVYNTDTEVPAAGPEPAPQPVSSEQPRGPAQTLDNIADDLNLSKAQRRHLFGRNAEASKSQVLHFNTDREYAANQEMAHTADSAALQHNPVRAIAPGKHSLQQLVNAASSQREALEESFASGRRNKQEAGSKYGW